MPDVFSLCVMSHPTIWFLILGLLLFIHSFMGYCLVWPPLLNTGINAKPSTIEDQFITGPSFFKI